MRLMRPLIERTFRFGDVERHAISVSMMNTCTCGITFGDNKKLERHVSRSNKNANLLALNTALSRCCIQCHRIFDDSARLIQAAWHNAISNPRYTIHLARPMTQTS